MIGAAAPTENTEAKAYSASYPAKVIAPNLGTTHTNWS
jgi:hypothetical protein